MLSLDSAQALTRGSPVGVASVLGQLHPARGTYTGVCLANGQPALMGQVSYVMGNRSARLTFLAPESTPPAAGFTGLLEGLAWQAGEMGAFSLLGEVDEQSPTFESIRRAGFSVYAWQRIWRLLLPSESSAKPNGWQPASSLDEQPVRNLFQMLVPPLVQSAEPLSNRKLNGLIYRQNGDLMAYVECVYGPRGIYLTPLIHPDIQDGLSLLRGLMPALAPRLGRPIYLAVRSYQAWLENVLAEIPAEAAPRQALLVKHLTSMQRVPLNARLVAIDSRAAEQTTAPMVNHFEDSAMESSSGHAALSEASRQAKEETLRYVPGDTSI